MKILTISGSLRAHSTNTELLRAASLLATPGFSIDEYADLGTLPHFNPDIEETDLPPRVAELRAAVDRANALIICSPEYAHGVPGSLKNALDWLVGGHEMVGKRIALWQSSTWSTHAPAQLAEILRTMSSVVVADAAVVVNLRGTVPRAAEIAGDPGHAAAILGALQKLLPA